MKKTTKHVFVVIRLDTFLLGKGEIERAVTVKEVVMTQEEAEAEVRRLSSINNDKGCNYFWRITRLVEKPQKVTVDPTEAGRGV